LKRKEEEVAAARKAQLTEEIEGKPKKTAAKKAPAKGKAGKSSGMISFDDSKDEDDVF
jgi:hypothetical protein